MIVIMAEKESVAKAIAEGIELNNFEKTYEGFYTGLDEECEKVVIVHSQGHCIELLEPEEIDKKYEKWNIKNLPIPFTDEKLKVKAGKERRTEKIEQYLKNADVIINAGDSGREGELIQRWLLKHAGIERIVYRLWTSSLTKDAIKKAYNEVMNDRNPRHHNHEKYKALNNLYAAGRARAIFDKYTGYNYSRLISLTKTDGVTVNYGRCKSPLTHAIIQRDLEIENFVKKPYSYVSATLSINNGFTKVKTTVVDEKLKTKEYTHEEAEKAVLGLEKTAEIVSIKKDLKVNNPPKPYDILTLQKEMSKKYDYDADYTLGICQKLYDKYHILSYPRTDSRYLTSDLKNQLLGILSKLDFGNFSSYVSIAKSGSIASRYFNDKKVVDHHGLIPVVPKGGIEEAYLQLNTSEKNVYDAIVLNFISLFLKPQKYEKTEVVLTSGKENLLFNFKSIIDNGYTSIYKEIDDDGLREIVLGNISEGDNLVIKEIEVVDTETKPKKHFTTASILDYMKIHNIGTGATRDSLLKELTERKGSNKVSAIEKKGKYFVSTNFARKVDELIPDELKSIDFLSTIDTKLAEIQTGTLSLKQFLAIMEDDFSIMYKKMTKNKQIIISNGKPEKKSIGNCPLCGKPINENSKAYGCSGYKEGCKFTIWKTVAGKKLPMSAVKMLIAGKETDLVKGFKSRSGNKFNAKLKLKVDGTGVDFIFDNNCKN